MCLAIPGQLQARFESAGLPMGRVSFAGLCKEVCLAYVPEAKLGDYVVVHVGFAISCIDVAEAERMLQMLDELGEAPETEIEAEIETGAGVAFTPDKKDGSDALS